MLLNCAVGEDSWESLGQGDQIIKPKGNQSWIFIGRTDAEAEAPILWPPDAKNWLIWKDPDAGKDWSQEEKGMTEDEMVGCYHRVDGHKSEQAPWVSVMYREAWRDAVHGVAKSQTRLSDWTEPYRYAVLLCYPLFINMYTFKNDICMKSFTIVPGTQWLSDVGSVYICMRDFPK